jgi:hypothetical protein
MSSLAQIGAIVGHTVVLRCRSGLEEKVSWSHQRSASTPKAIVARYGLILGDFQQQFALQTTPSGAQNLFFKDAAVDNSGEYVCTDDDGLGPVIVSYNVTIQGRLNTPLTKLGILTETA